MKTKFDDMISALTLLEKNCLLYPVWHTSVTSSASTLIENITNLFDVQSEIRIVSLNDNLVINHVQIDLSHSKATYFAQILSSRGLLSVTLKKGVELDEILLLIDLIHKIPYKNHLIYFPDIQAAMSKLINITVEEIDFSNIKYTVNDTTLINFGEYNDIIRQFYINSEVDLQSYDETLKAHLSLGIEDEDIHNKQHFFDAINHMISKVDSEVKNQIIDISLQEINESQESDLNEILSYIDSDMISDMVDRAQSEENLISHSLFELLSAINRVRKASNSVDEPNINQTDMSDDQVKKLVEREHYETYISTEYSHMLQNLSSVAVNPLENLTHNIFFESSYINKTVIKALINLTGDKSDKSTHSDFSNRIEKMIHEFIINRDWDFIASLLYSDTVSNFLKQETTISLISDGVISQESFNNPYVVKIIQNSGSANVVWLIDYYIKKYNIHVNRSLLKLILFFKDDAVKLAIQKLTNDQSTNIDALIIIIQNNTQHIERSLLAQLFNSDKIKVKLLAIKLLLSQDDAHVVNDIRTLLTSKNYVLIYNICDLIKSYRINELTDSLIKKVKFIYINEDILELNLKLMDTISELDEQLSTVLISKINKRKFSLSPKNLQVMKNHIRGVNHDI